MQKMTVSTLLSSIFIASGNASAALLVDANFDGNATATLSGQSAATSGTGLGTANWSIGGGVSAIVVAGNLAFSDLNNGTGNRLSLSSTATQNFSAALNLTGGAYTGTLWSSTIFKIGTTTSTGRAELVRINSSSATAGNNSRYRSYADASSGATSLAGVTYYNDVGGGNVTNAAPAAGTTYLSISSFTNVGSTLSVLVVGTANQYILTEAQYEYFRDSTPDGFDVADLGVSTGAGVGFIFAKASATATATGATTNEFNTGNLLTIGLYSGFTAEYDNVRYASSLDSVVPEPASLSMLASVVGLASLRRRR